MHNHEPKNASTNSPINSIDTTQYSRSTEGIRALFEDANRITDSESKPLTLNDEFLTHWSQPFPFEFVTTYYRNDPLQAEKLQAIALGDLYLLGKDYADLAKRELTTRERLLKVHPPVDLSLSGPIDTSNHYQTINEIRDAVERSALQAIDTSQIEAATELALKCGDCVEPDLAKRVNNFLAQLKTDNRFNDLALLRLTSGTRDLVTQSVLGDLEYPAAKVSLHTAGKALDFGLSSVAKTAWANELKQPYTPDNSETLEVAIARMLNEQETQPTISELLERKLISADSAPGRLYRLLHDELALFLLDETPFFTTLNDEGSKVETVHPVFHIYMP